MIKKRLTKWYPTREEIERKSRVGVDLQRLYDAADRISQNSRYGTANFIVCSPEVANILNDLYPSLTTQQAANYTNTWCGTTFFTGTND